MKTESASRTFVGSVVCVDLVGYSKRSVAQQGAIKADFVKLLQQSLKGVRPEDRIILDTGDGAAVSFLGDPEACLKFAIRMRDTMNGNAAKLGCAPGDEGPVRIAINMGPVKLAVDMNGHPNIIGDGISVAEKAVAFAEPGQLVVTRPFYDMVSRISDEHAQIFRYEGVRTDRNVREHEIYSVIPAARPEPRAEPEAKPAEPPPKPAAAPAPKAEAPREGESPFAAFLRDPAKFGIAAASLAAIVVLEGWMLASRSPKPEAVAVSGPAPATTLPPPAPAPTMAPRPEPPRPVETKPEPKKPEPKKPEPKKPEPKVEPKVEAKSPPAPEKKVEPRIEAKAPPPPPPPAPAAEKKVEKKPDPKPPEPRKEEPPRVIPPPRAAPPTIATAPAAPASVPVTEPTPVVREEPKPPVVAVAPPPAPTTVATPVSRAALNFPIAAINRGIERGVVRARLSISAAGTVTGVSILSADPPRVFDREATRSLEEWRFNPGADNRSYEVEIEFKR